MNADERRKILNPKIKFSLDVKHVTNMSFVPENSFMVLSAFIGVHRRQNAVAGLEMNARIVFAA
jgi:hypothetical protein